MAITDKKTTPDTIWVESMVSGRTLEPFVLVKWGDYNAQMTPDEARQHALSIMESANAAETDAFVFHWLTRDVVGTQAEKEAEFSRIIGDFKQFREARTEAFGGRK